MEFGRFTFFSGMCGQVEWKSEAWSCVQDYLAKRISQNAAFSAKCSGNGLIGLLKTYCLFNVRFKADLNIKL